MWRKLHIWRSHVCAFMESGPGVISVSVFMWHNTQRSTYNTDIDIDMLGTLQRGTMDYGIHLDSVVLRTQELPDTVWNIGWASATQHYLCLEMNKTLKGLSRIYSDPLIELIDWAFVSTARDDMKIRSEEKVETVFTLFLLGEVL